MRKNLLLTGLLATMGHWCMAQQPRAENDTAKNLNEVEITASKVPLTIRETAKPVLIITREELAQSGGKDLPEILNEQPGIVVNGANSNPAQEQYIYIRGASAEYTMIMIDGIPMNDPSGDEFPFDVRMIPLEMIDHIEILKGSESTLYGTDAIAGVINIITRQGGDKPISVYGGGSAGGFNTYKANIGLEGSIKKLSYNASYQHDFSEGFAEATDTTGKANFTKDGYQVNAVQASLTYKPIDNLKFSPFFRYENFSGEYPDGPFQDGTNRFEYKLFNPGIVSQFSVKDFNLVASYGFNESNRSYFQPTVDTLYYKGLFHHADLFGSYRFEKYFRVMAGFNYQNYHLLDTTTTEQNPATYILSPYATFLISDLKGFSCEAGYRFVHHSKYGNNSTYSLSPGYQANKHVKVYATFGTGFKAPTLYELYGQFGANPGLKPEQSLSVEGGLQTSFAHNKLQISACGYYTNVTNQIIYTTTEGYINENKQIDYGAEATLTYNINKIISVNGYYNFITGAVTTKGSTNQDSTYYDLIRIPKNGFSIGAELHPVASLFLSLQLHYIGNRIDYYYDPNPPYNIVVEPLKQYPLLNLYAEYKFFTGHLTLFMDLKNITNSHYIEVYGYNSPGFNLTGGIRFFY